MSYDISIVDPATHGVISFEEKHEIRGGTYQLGGSHLAELNITYNYAPHFQRVLGPRGIRELYGQTVRESGALLLEAASKLKDDATYDYWEATEGNAKVALLSLLVLRNQALIEGHGDAIWSGD